MEKVGTGYNDNEVEKAVHQVFFNGNFSKISIHPMLGKACSAVDEEQVKAVSAEPRREKNRHHFYSPRLTMQGTG